MIYDGFIETASGLLVPESAVRPRRVLAVDLFAGCGGFSLGFHSSGIHVIGAVELDFPAATTYICNLARPGIRIHFDTEERGQAFEKYLQKAWKRRGKSGLLAPFVAGSGWISHYPEEPGCEHFWIADVRTLKGADLLDTLGLDPGQLDCVFGGPPCQGFSMAGKQDEHDPRNNLVLEFLRVAIEAEARTFVMENVPPLLTNAKFRPLWDEYKRRAVEAGYTVVANVLDAVNFGVPQYRRRAFIVGTLGDLPAYQFPMPTTWSMGAGPGIDEWDMMKTAEEEAEPESAAAVQGDLFGGDPEGRAV